MQPRFEIGSLYLKLSTEMIIPDIPFQESSAVTGIHAESWSHEAVSYLNQFHANAPLYFQRPSESNQINYDGQGQHMATCTPILASQHVPSQESAQSLHSPMQTTPAVDTRRASKLQIPTNPRITSFSLGVPRSEKETMTPDAAVRPAYVSVLLPKNSNVTPSHNAMDAVLKVFSIACLVAFFISK